MMNITRRTTTLASNIRRFATAICRPHIEDEGDWFYSSEWWSEFDDPNARTVFREVSDKGNGVVSVLAHPSSKPVKCITVSSFPSSFIYA